MISQYTDRYCLIRIIYFFITKSLKIPNERKYKDMIIYFNFFPFLKVCFNCLISVRYEKYKKIWFCSFWAREFFQLVCLAGIEVSRSEKFLIKNGYLAVICDSQVLSWRGQSTETSNLNLNCWNDCLFPIWTS